MKMIKEIILERLMNNKSEYAINIFYIGKCSHADVYDWLKTQKIVKQSGYDVIFRDNPNTPENEVAQLFIKKSDVLVRDDDTVSLQKKMNLDFDGFMNKPRKKSLLRKIIGD